MAPWDDGDGEKPRWSPSPEQVPFSGQLSWELLLNPSSQHGESYGTPKGNGERGFVSQKGVQNNRESCGLGGVRSCCRGGCGSLKGVLRGHWLGLAQGVRSRAQGESLRPLPAWGSLPHCTLQLNQPPTSGSA